MEWRKSPHYQLDFLLLFFIKKKELEVTDRKKTIKLNTKDHP
tara:strand:- start:153 stop:278 length:126 start_codon:yes stop_codon:yes gene_type:complete